MSQGGSGGVCDHPSDRFEKENDMAYTIVFKIEGSADVKVQAERGENLLELARRVGVAIDAPCAGNGTCGKCRVKLISGALETEKNPHLSQEDFDAQWRLACQCAVNGDAVVTKAVAGYALDRLSIDECGLDRVDRMILDLLGCGLDVYKELLD